MRPSRKKPNPAPPLPQTPVKHASRSLQIAATALIAAAVIATGAWFYWHRTHPIAVQSQSDYVNPEVCAACHADIAATYRKTGMGRSFSRPTTQNLIEDYTRNNTLDHKLSGYSYTMVQHDGKFFERRNTIGFDGKEADIVEQQIDYVIGSGNHAQTYLHRTPQGQLNELPVSWYVENSGSWGMSPGFDRRDQEDIHRPITPECLFCHNGYPQMDQETLRNLKQSNIFPAKLPEGIDCQRCHGPGRAHIAAVTAKNSTLELIRASIVNPGRLPRDQQLEVCMQCHLETSSRNMPNEIRAYERGVLSYRPGQPLGDYKIYFDRDKDKTDDTFEVAHAAYRLRQSQCFLKSEMTCLTCHNPHDIPRGEAAIQTYVGVCVKCHQAAAHRSALPVGSNCIGCHMPKRRTEDVVHVIMTDHFIRSYKPSRDLLAPIPEEIPQKNSSAVVAYYPPDYAKKPDAELYLAVADVEAGKGAESLSRLRTVLSRLSPQAPDPYFELGRGYGHLGNNAEAIRWFDTALSHESDYYPALLELGPALLAAGQEPRALEVLKRTIALYPNDDQLLSNLGNVYLRMNMLTEAQSTLNRAVAANPERADAYNLLGLAALRTGDKTAAEKSFREAIRWQPDLAEAQNNLATLLTGTHSFPEAEFHFQKALAINPAYADAHHGYGLLLILTGAIPRAEAELRQAVRLNPDLAQAHSDFADLLAAQGQIAEAAEEYQQVLRLNPSQDDAYLGLGLALLRQHKPEEARPYLEKAAASSDTDLSHAANQALSQLGR
jgi:predicted CXXCH cytochrome family protein